MNVEYISDADSIDFVIIYIEATPQGTKVSFATLLGTFYYYFAYDA